MNAWDPFDTSTTTKVASESADIIFKQKIVQKTLMCLYIEGQLLLSIREKSCPYQSSDYASEQVSDEKYLENNNRKKINNNNNGVNELLI